MSDYSSYRNKSTKSDLIKSMMGHPGTRKLIKDAMASPVGSSARTRLAKIMKTSETLHLKPHDGVGGPGMMQLRQAEYSQQPYKEPKSYTGLIYFGALPEMRSTKQRSGGSMDGQGGPGDGQGGSGQTMFQSNLNTLGSWGMNAANAIGSAAKTVGNVAGAAYNVIPNTIGNVAQGTSDYFFKPITPIESIPSAPVAPTKTGSATTSTGSSAANIPPAKIAPVTSSGIPSSSNNFSSGAQTGSNTSTGTQTGGTAGSNSGTPSATPNAATVQSAVNSNQGAGMFAISQLSDPNNPMTQGMSPAQQQADAQKDAESKYGLTQYKNRMDEINEAGVTLPTDLQAYVRGRDQYVNQIQGMIDNYKDSMTKQDLSDPSDRSRATSYLNYLYTLQGKQEARYTDYINQSINQYNSDIKVATTQYQDTLSQINQEVTSSANIYKEQFTMYANALSDMYNAVDGAPEKALRLNLLQEQINESKANQVKIAGEGYYNNNLIKANTALTGYTHDSNGYLLPNTDINQIAETLSGSPDVDTMNIIQSFDIAAQKTFNAPSTDKNSAGQDMTNSTKLEYGDNTMAQYKSIVDGFNSSGNTELASTYMQHAAVVARKLASLKTSSLTANPQSSAGYKEAITYLQAHPGTFNFRTPPTLEQFTQKLIASVPGIDPAIASSVYSEFTQYTSQPNSTPQGFVKSKLYDLQSTDQRTGANPPKSDTEILNDVTGYTALSIFNKYFTADPSASVNPAANK
jgi:hypothetical protein